MKSVFLHLLAVAVACGCRVQDPGAALILPHEEGAAAMNAGVPAPDPPASRRFSVIAVGDVMLGKIAQSTIRENGLDYPFGAVREVLDAHDIAFANLEAPITSRGKEKVKKQYRLRVNPQQARALTRSSIDVVSLANNHMMDFGETGLSDTLKHLDTWNIRHVGAGSDLERSHAPARLEAAGTEVIFLAYCAWYPAPIHARENRPGVSPLDRELILEDVRTHKRDDNLVFVSMHWGVQHTDRATSGQVNLAHDIIDAGADAILGHHPHRPQEVEVYRGRLIVYSLGNFLFGYYNKIYRHNIALVLEYDGTEPSAARILPVAGKNGSIKFRPHFLEGKTGLAVLGNVASLSKRFDTAIDVTPTAAEIDLGTGQ
ncbi:MAG: CapA family protein [Deltaproteobacteria bacterium]|nr:CapA family protein [Deltaproteobacteria bacterium]